MTRAEENSPTPPTTASGEFTMSSITGKLILAMVRGSDYAHAGEEEAIDLVLGPLTKTAQTRLLDVGCGIGGSARYVVERGWGKVTGIDLDPANVEAANKRHPGLEFICSDVVDLAQNVTGRFDVLYSLNAFFLFADQVAALRAMRAVAHPSAKLAIFDYVDLGGYVQWKQEQKTRGLRHPLVLDRLDDRLQGSGWMVDRIVPAHTDYLRWYETLVTRIVSKREAIVADSSAGFFDYVLGRYEDTCDDLRAGRLGGATIYATAI